MLKTTYFLIPNTVDLEPQPVITWQNKINTVNHVSDVILDMKNRKNLSTMVRLSDRIRIVKKDMGIAISPNVDNKSISVVITNHGSLVQQPISILR